MTDKCRRRMNGRKEYITTEITQKKMRHRRRGGEEEEGAKKKREAQKKEGGSYVTERGWRIPVLEQGVPSS